MKFKFKNNKQKISIPIALNRRRMEIIATQIFE